IGLMKDRGIQNPEDAAVLFDASQPKAKGKPRSFTTRMPFVSPEGEKDEKFEQLMANPEQFMMDEMTAALAGATEDTE
ncbi:MAG: hypothetical protein ACREIC_21400, partial [Limisphaerales bacterium]